MRRRKYRQAVMYVAVLLVGMLVMIIGLGGLALIRVQSRTAEGANQVVAARLYAQSAIEKALHTLAHDAGWRTTYENDVWVPDQAIGYGSFTWKLVDEVYGDLSADPNGPVRLYGKGTAGDAVRVYSVLLEPETITRNVLSNPGFENGTTDWYVMWWGGADMELDTSDPHSGAGCAHLKNRDNPWDGPAQDVTSVVENGTTYEVVFWVDMGSHPDDVRGVFRIESTGGGVTYPQFQVTPGAGWVEITGTITPVWSGDLISAEFYIGTWFFAEPFRVDDVIVKVATSTTPMVTVPGTWRRVGDDAAPSEPNVPPS